MMMRSIPTVTFEKAVDDVLGMRVFAVNSYNGGQFHEREIALILPFILAVLLSPPEILTFDAHIHVINRQFYHGGDIGQRVKDGQFDLPRARKGGLNALFFSLFVTEEYYPQHYETKQALRLMDLALRQLEQNRETIELARNGRDVDRIVASGKIAAVLDIEGSLDSGGDLAILRRDYP